MTVSIREKIQIVAIVSCAAVLVSCAKGPNSVSAAADSGARSVASVQAEASTTTATTNSAFTSTIVAKNSGSCFDVPGAKSTVGLGIQQYKCNGGSNQSFKFIPNATSYRLQVVGDGLCLDNASDGWHVVQTTCNSASATQNFTVTATSIAGYYQIKNENGGCLNINGASSSNGALVITYSCSAATNEDFQLAGYVGPVPVTAVPVSGNTTIALSSYASIKHEG